MIGKLGLNGQIMNVVIVEDFTCWADDLLKQMLALYLGS